MVRDPIERIVSHYLHRVDANRERRSLEETLRDIERGTGMVFVNRSRYFMQIERWLEHFPSERLLVVAQEDLRADTAGTLARAFRFLSVDGSFVSERFTRVTTPRARSGLPSAWPSASSDRSRASPTGFPPGQPRASAARTGAPLGERSHDRS